MVRSERDLKCMEFSIKLLRIVGCWPYLSQKHEKFEQKYFIYTAIMFTISFIYVLILVYGLTIHYKLWKTFDEAVEDLIVVSTGSIVIFKIIVIIMNQTKLQNLVDYLNNSLNVRELKDDEEKAVMKACIKHEKSLTKVYVFSGYCITTLYTISSIIRMVRQRSKDSPYSLPLKYPFQPRGFLYAICYAQQVLVMILNGHIGTVTDTFFSSFAFYICGHLKILRNRIQKEGDIITKGFVSYHNEIIRLIRNIQAIYGPFLTFQFITTSLLICLGLIQVTQTNNIKLLHYLKCVIYVSIKLTQLFLYCWYGQQVMEQSTNIFYGVYFGKWNEEQSRAMTENFKIAMLRTQKPVEIRAGNYFTVSLPTLASVMNTAYSFFTMAKSFQKN